MTRQQADPSSHSRWIVPLTIALLAVAGCGSAADQAEVVSVTSLSVDACQLVRPNVVELALGVTGDKVAGPNPFAGGSCNWHSSDPFCSMRSLGVEVRSGVTAQEDFLAARAIAERLRDVAGLGDGAFYSADVLPADSYVEVSHLDVREGQTWMRFTITGRVGDGAQDILNRVAASVVATA